MRYWILSWSSVRNLVVLLVGCLLIGCSGGDPASLSGTVKYAGEPIEDGVIRLVPVEGAPGPGGSTKIENGSYEIARGSGLLAGKHAVTFSATRAATAAEISAQKREEALEEEEDEDDEEDVAAPADRSSLRVSFLPEKYLRPTDIFVELKPGENTQDFDLQP